MTHLYLNPVKFIFLIVLLPTIVFANPSFDTATNTLNIPFLEIDGQAPLTNVNVQLKPDGTYNIVSVNSLSTPAPALPITGTYSFAKHRTGDILYSADGTLWEIKGDNNCTVTGAQNYTIGQGTSSLSSPVNGVKTNYYLEIEGSACTYFIEEISYEYIIVSGTYEFENQNYGIVDGQVYGNLIGTSNGIVWAVLGILIDSVAWEENEFKIIYGTDAIGDPIIGTKTDYLMIINGSRRAFFLAPL